MSRRPPKPAPVIVKRAPEQRRKLPPELEAFARSDDEKLRIRRPRTDQGRVRDPREGYTVAGVSNRDARAVYDVRTEAMRAIWAGGAADEAALAQLGQLFHEARVLELWRARRLTAFEAYAEEVVGVPAERAASLAREYAERIGEPLGPLSERAIALWLRTEAGLYEGDEQARARIRHRDGVQQLELSVALAHASTALAGAGARHLPLARTAEAQATRREDARREDARREDTRHGGEHYADERPLYRERRHVADERIAHDHESDEERHLHEEPDLEEERRAPDERSVERELDVHHERSLNDESDLETAGVFEEHDAAPDSPGFDAEPRTSAELDEEPRSSVELDEEPRSSHEIDTEDRVDEVPSELPEASASSRPPVAPLSRAPEPGGARLLTRKPRHSEDHDRGFSARGDQRADRSDRPAQGHGGRGGWREPSRDDRGRAGDDRPFQRARRDERPFERDRDRRDERPFQRAGGEERPFERGRRDERPFQRAGGAERPFERGRRDDRPFRDRGQSERGFAGDARNGRAPFERRFDERSGDRDARRDTRDPRQSNMREGRGERDARSNRFADRGDRPRGDGRERRGGDASFDRRDRPRNDARPAWGKRPSEAGRREDAPRFDRPQRNDDRGRFGRGQAGDRPRRDEGRGFGDRRDAPPKSFGGGGRPKPGKGFGARQPLVRKPKADDTPPKKKREPDDDE